MFTQISVRCFCCGEPVNAHEAERFVMRTGHDHSTESVQEFAHSSCEPRVALNAISVENDTVVIRV